MSSSRTALAQSEESFTPQILTEASKSRKPCTSKRDAFAKHLDALMADKAIDPMRDAVTAFDWLDTLAAVIKDVAEGGLNKPNSSASCGSERKALHQITHLAAIGSYLAANFGNTLDADQESLSDEHLPRLLAALPEGGTQ